MVRGGDLTGSVYDISQVSYSSGLELGPLLVQVNHAFDLTTCGIDCREMLTVCVLCIRAVLIDLPSF